MVLKPYGNPKSILGGLQAVKKMVNQVLLTFRDDLSKRKAAFQIIPCIRSSFRLCKRNWRYLVLENIVIPIAVCTHWACQFKGKSVCDLIIVRSAEVHPVGIACQTTF